MDKLIMSLIEEVSDLHGIPQGAYNIRANGEGAGRHTRPYYPDRTA